MPSRRMLLRHLWAMVQTRAEAGGLVLQLQRTAVAQGLLFGAVAAVAAMAFTTAAIIWIAVVAPPEWRGWALGIVALALLGAAYFAAVTAGKRLRRDAALIADYSRGLKLDLAMVNLALKDPDAEKEEDVAERERAKQAVRDAAMAKAATPSTAEGGAAPAPDGPSFETAQAAMKAASTTTGGPAATAGAGIGAGAGAGGAYASTSTGSSALRDTEPTTEQAPVERELPDTLLGTDGAQSATAATPPDDTSPSATDAEEQRRRSHGTA